MKSPFEDFCKICDHISEKQWKSIKGYIVKRPLTDEDSQSLRAEAQNWLQTIGNDFLIDEKLIATILRWATDAGLLEEKFRKVWPWRSANEIKAILHGEYVEAAADVYTNHLERVENSSKMWRLPIYILIDTSGSMRGEPIESVKVGLTDFIATLRNNPYALETAYISIITYAREAKQILPPTMLGVFVMPEIAIQESAPKHLGAALKYFCQKVKIEVKKDWKPTLLLFTSGKVADVMDYNLIVPKVKRLNIENIIVFLPSLKSKTEQLQNLTDLVYNLDTMDATAWKTIISHTFDFIEAPISDWDSSELPKPPKEINIVI